VPRRSSSIEVVIPELRQPRRGPVTFASAQEPTWPRPRAKALMWRSAPQPDQASRCDLRCFRPAGWREPWRSVLPEVVMHPALLLRPEQATVSRSGPDAAMALP
jgi:hypothetical protein